MALYDESHNERPRNVFAAHLARPFKRAVDLVRNRVNDLALRMNSPAFLDQYPASAVPYTFSKLYGPIPLTTPRRFISGLNGFEKLAALVNPGTFILPRNGNIFVNREGAFYMVDTNAHGFVSMTWEADPGGIGAVVFGGPTVGDLFDSVVVNNGGAVALDYFFSTVGGDARKPNICFDIELYDRKRQRRLHDEQLPPQVLSAQGYSNKALASPIRFDVNTEIEPRLRVLEVRMADLLDTDDAFNDALVVAYINLTFLGYKVLAV